MKLRYYQQDAMDAIVSNSYRRPGQNPLVVIPTAGGKSIVIAELCKYALTTFEDQKILVVTHSKELIKQNYDKFHELEHDIDAGIYSAGLDRRDTEHDVVFCGIQSVYDKPELFEGVTLILVDEAHLIPHDDNTMYRKFISAMRVPVVGFTATHFRLDVGYLTDGEEALFDYVTYDASSPEVFAKLVNDGFLSPLVSKEDKSAYNVAQLKVNGNDFDAQQTAEVMSDVAATYVALQSVIEKGAERKHWLIFASSINHAELITEFLNNMDIKTAVIHSKMTGDRDEVISDFKAGKYRALVNVNVLTTGFDFPAIDLIVLLRPTISPVLHVQMLGRGCRVAEGKKNCLVLDFVGNTMRLGPINNPQVLPAGSRGGQVRAQDRADEILKTCEHCGAIVERTEAVCPMCDEPFPINKEINIVASDVDLMDTGSNVIENFWKDVDEIDYGIHKKEGKPDSIRVTYKCGMQRFSEWVCPHHQGYARTKALRWIDERLGYYAASIPIWQIVNNLRTDAKEPSRIQVDPNGKFPRILHYDFNGTQ